MDCSTPGFPVHHQLPELAQTHVPQVGNAIQPSQPPSSSSPAFNLAQHQGLFQWVSCLYQVAKVLELHLQPKNTGVGSLSLLQQIFLTQEYNQGLLHCRQILYQLSFPLPGKPELTFIYHHISKEVENRQIDYRKLSIWQALH